MQRWIASHNIEDFERMLAAETDPAKKVLLEGLLEDERRKYREAVLAHQPRPSNAR